MSLYGRLSAIRAGRRRSGPSLPFLTILPVFLLLAAGCAQTQQLGHNSASRPKDPVNLGKPSLSPDGRLVALSISVRGVRGSKIVVFDVESRALRTFDSPPDQIWLWPSFSPAGDRLVFMRLCVGRCRSGRKGYHVAILDLKTGIATTRTVDPHLYRRWPILAPGGRYVFYTTIWFPNADRPLPRRYARRWAGALTGRVHMLDLETGEERKVSLRKFGINYFLVLLPTGFIDSRTLVVRGKMPSVTMEEWPGESLPVIKELKRRAERLQVPRPRGDAWNLTYPYTLVFDRPFKLASRPPHLQDLDLLQSDWVRRTPHLSISYDTGLLAFVGRSAGSRRENASKVYGDSEYSILLGDLKTVRQATSLRTYPKYLTISKSGNRVAYIFDEKRNNYQNLWMLDVATGKVWQTGLKKRLLKLYPPKNRSKS